MIGAITAGLYGTGVPPVTNSYESIATVTVGSGGTAYVEFTGIPSTYKHLQLRCSIQSTAGFETYSDMLMRLNSDSSANYSAHQLQGNGSSASASSFVSQTSLRIDGYGSSSPVSSFGAVIIDYLDYTSTTKNKTVRALGGYDQNGSGRVGLYSGQWFKTPEAITSIRLTEDGPTGLFSQHSKFALYGIKG